MLNNSINKFLEELSSKESTPGGGSASALAGSIGASLMAMVANLTIGRKKYKKEEPLMKEILQESQKLRNELAELVEKDTEAFNEVAAVFKMPKNTEEEKANRKVAMQEALKIAAIVPFQIMKKTIHALKLYKKSLGHTNVSTITDTGVGALCLKAALKGAWLNVKINLSSIKDEDFLQKYSDKANNLLSEGVKIADSIFKEVVKNL